VPSLNVAYFATTRMARRGALVAESALIVRTAFAVALTGVFALPALSEEPYLEFARRLRENGMPDIAADYLQHLAERKPSAEVSALIPLELGRARFDVAVREGDLKKRNQQFSAARSAYESFLTTHRDDPRFAEIQLELARLIALEGKLLLDQAKQQESSAARKDLTAQAGRLFKDAADQLAHATGAVDKRLSQLQDSTKNEEKARKTDLETIRSRARLDEAINLINRSATLLESRDTKGRASTITEAKKLLTVLAAGDETDPLTWQAKVWQGRLSEEIDARPEAVRIYSELAKQTAPAAAAAARTAGYLFLRVQANEEQAPDRAARVRQVVSACEDWLKTHRDVIDSPEGQGVRYILATLLEEQARPGIVRPQNQANAPPRITTAYQATLAKAEHIYKDLSATENDYTDRARRRRNAILVILLGDRARDVAKLITFEECYVTAQVEAADLGRGRAPPEERTERLAKIVSCLKRGLFLAGKGDNPNDVTDARLMLAYAYLAAGEPYQAAILAEYLSRSSPIGRRAAEAAAYALQAYAAILDGDRRRNAGADEIKADQRRLRGVAELMEKTWPNEEATDMARHQLGGFLVEDRNYLDAIAMLGRVAPTYAGFAEARYQEGAAAQKAQGDDLVSAAKKKELLRRAIADLEKVPDPSPGASEQTTLAGCLARLEFGNLLLLDVKPDGTNFGRAAEVAKQIAKLVPELSLEESYATQVAAEANRLKLAAAGGRALQLIAAEKFEEARAGLAPLVAAAEKDANQKDVYEPLREAQRQIVTLALRCAIIENKAGEADKALFLLRRICPPDGPGAANSRLLQVVIDLKREAVAFKEKGETARRDRLERGLTGFVDELAKAPNLTSEVRLFLASAYASLDQHTKAADLLKDFPAAAEGDGAKRYQAVRVALMREYRLGRQFQQASAVVNDALKSWGKNNLDVQRERVLLLEDADNLGAAFKAAREIEDALKKGWNDFERAGRDEKAADEAERSAKTEDERTKAQQAKAEATARRAAAEPLREAYWEFYFYEIGIVLKNDLKKAKDAADKERRLGVIAAAIKKLEDGQADFGGKDLRARYRALVDGEPMLKQKYLEARGKRLYADPGGKD
jgi:hypothetical protein